MRYELEEASDDEIEYEEIEINDEEEW